MSDGRNRRDDVYPIGKKNPNLPFHPAVRAGDFIFVSGQVAKDQRRQHDLPASSRRKPPAPSSQIAFWRRKARRSPTWCA